MTTSEREQTCEKIAKLLYAHPDKKIILDNGRILYHSLYKHHLPLPEQLPPLAADNSAGLRVDEVLAYEEDAREGVGVQIALSALDDGGPRYVNVNSIDGAIDDDEDTEYVRIDTLDLEDADDRLLGAILTAMLKDADKDMPDELPAGERSANDIVADARRCLRNIIVGNVKTLHYRLNDSSPDFVAGEDYTADVDDYDCGKVHFRVTVSDLRTDYEAVEDRTVKAVRVTLDDSIFVESEEDDGCETSADELSTDELAALARWSEKAVGD